MKKTLLVPIFLFMVGCADNKKTSEVSEEITSLNQLVSDLDYFSLREEFDNFKNQLPKKDSLYFKAIIISAFNKPKESNKLIEEFLKHSEQGIDDTLTKKLLQTKLINHIYLSEYSKALQTNEILQQKYDRLLDSVALEDLRNTHKIWSSLSNVPKQRAIINKDVTLPIKKDKAGLSTVPVNFGDIPMDFVFDTGANFSVVQKSVAEALGMEIIPANFKVGAATGLEVKSDLAIAKKLELGSITLENVIFLVFEDKDLSFPSIEYEIKGILGFPAIRSLQEIHITKDSLFIPAKPKDFALYNLAYNEYMPIVKAHYKDDDLRFNFDTGAQETSLYSRFFQKYRHDIESKNKKTNFRTGGAGGHISFEGYKLDTVKLAIGNSNAILNDIQVFPEKIGTADGLHGNLGQDFIQQFGTMIISFKDASLLFE